MPRRYAAARPASSAAGLPGGRARLLRQRLVVFVTVTVLVALGIAAAQGCQSDAQGARVGPAQTSSARG
jgi:hypothetical protein